MLTIYIATLIVTNLIFLCEMKMFLAQIDHYSNNNTNRKNTNDHHNDYMADLEIQSVDVGKPVELKCVSPKDFSRCLFSKTDGNLYYRIRPKASFEENRLQCLCDVSSSKIDLNL